MTMPGDERGWRAIYRARIAETDLAEAQQARERFAKNPNDEQAKEEMMMAINNCLQALRKPKP